MKWLSVSKAGQGLTNLIVYFSLLYKLPSRQDDKNYWLIRLLASALSLKKYYIELKKLKICINVRFSYLLKIRAKRN